jgi:DNA-binding transcriptional MerR regulator
MTIGEVSKRAGCSPPTIRYYESIGLLPRAARTSKGRRSYGWPDVFRLTFIRRARDFGLGIEQVRELLAVQADPKSACRPAAELIEGHLRAIRHKRAELRLIEQSLQSMLQRCAGGCGVTADVPCTIFDDIVAPTDANAS